MLSNTNIVFRESEVKPPVVKTRVKVQPATKSKQSAKTMQSESLQKYNKKSSFAPILEEETYDNVIVNKTSDDGVEEPSGPSYLSALKFASVYNETVK